MPIYRHIVNIQTLEDGNFKINVQYGQRTMFSGTVDGTISIRDFLTEQLALSPGDRIELNYLDEETDRARIGNPRGAPVAKARAGRKKDG